MNRIKYLLIFLIFSYSTSCKKEEIVKQPEEIVVGGKSIKIQDSTFIIYNHHSTGLTAQDGNIFWDEPTGVLTIPKAVANQMGHRYIENGIFICDLDTSGILRRIIKLDSTSTNYIINTGDADFEDFFSDLNVQLSTDESETMLGSTILDHEDISDALTDENGFLHPFKIVEYDENENVLSSWSA